MAKQGKQNPSKTSDKNSRKRVSTRGNKTQRAYQESLKEAADMMGAFSFPMVGLVSRPLPKAAQRIRMYVGIR